MYFFGVSSRFTGARRFLVHTQVQDQDAGLAGVEAYADAGLRLDLVHGLKALEVCSPVDRQGHLCFFIRIEESDRGSGDR
jgi:hypothetical protein